MNSITFLYGTRFINLGSSIMRGQQLSDMMSEVINGVSYEPISDKFEHRILFLTKGAIQTSTTAILEKLKSKGNILLFDPLDSTPSYDKMQFADVIVVASQYAYDQYRISHPKKLCCLVDHHVDPRLSNIGPIFNQSLSVGYFGELINTITTPSISKQVSFVHVDTSRQSNTWLNQISKHNMHYILRNSESAKGPKPFLKGFVAAHMDCNMLVHEDQIDAIKWLGKDYPYLIKGPLTEKAVLDKLEYARSTYNTKTWEEGLEITRLIKDKTSNNHVTSQVLSILNLI